MKTVAGSEWTRVSSKYTWAAHTHAEKEYDMTSSTERAAMYGLQQQQNQDEHVRIGAMGRLTPDDRSHLLNLLRWSNVTLEASKDRVLAETLAAACLRRK